MSFDRALYYLGHQQVGALGTPLIAWPLQPKGSIGPKRVIHQLLKGNLLTSQISWIMLRLNVIPIGDLRHPVGNDRFPMISRFGQPCQNNRGVGLAIKF